MNLYDEYLARSLLSTMCTWSHVWHDHDSDFWNSRSRLSRGRTSWGKYLSIQTPAFSCGRHAYFQFAITICILRTKISPADAKLGCAWNLILRRSSQTVTGLHRELTKSRSLRRKTWQWELRRNPEIAWESFRSNFHRSANSIFIVFTFKKDQLLLRKDSYLYNLLNAQLLYVYVHIKKNSQPDKFDAQKLHYAFRSRNNDR